ncbi:hypothetical protein [uncultured Aliiroseovarius sp.]|uniref:hypothetical protein n=1 Tax=uncultured Aliiroseovarius sp. TaxID=1658783 RepID=UPI002596ECD7|nr:hypothetical protein [uncultured Aliiroseovarius sp.]
MTDLIEYSLPSSFNAEILFRDIVCGLGEQWGQKVLQETNCKSWHHNRLNRLFLEFSRASRWSTAGKSLSLAIAAHFLTGRWFVDSKTDIYIVSLSTNNKAAIGKLSDNLIENGLKQLHINNSMFPGKGKAQTVLTHPLRKEALTTLSSYGHDDPSVFASQLFGVASGLLFLENLKTVRPCIIGVSNDHSPPTYALLAVGKALGIPQFYVQHAPVTQFFPPLSVDLAILNDQHSETAYRQAAKRMKVSSNTRVIVQENYTAPLAGSVSFDAPLRICIALSMYPDLKALRELLTALQHGDKQPKITVRPHPRYGGDLQSLNREPYFSLSNSDEPLDKLIARTDLFIVTNSGISVELLKRGVPTIYHNPLDHQGYDYFGLVAGKILPEYPAKTPFDPINIEELFDHDWRTRVRGYFSGFQSKPEADGREVREVREWFSARLIESRNEK